MTGEIRVVRGERVASSASKALKHLDLGQAFVLRDMADILRAGERDIFSTEGSAIGSRWAPLKRPTVRARRRLAKRHGLQITGPSPILVLYGDLRAAMTVKGGAHEQFVGRNFVRLTVDQGRVNRHDRKRGLGMSLTARGQRRKPRGKSRYPDNIVEIHDKDRKIIGTPEPRLREMDRRVERYLESVAAILDGPS